MTEAPETGAAREVMERAIKRLGVLELLFLLLAALAALAAGALTAWLLGDALGWPFRPVWTATSLLYFLVPGAVAWLRIRREAAARPRDDRDDDGSRDDHGG